MPNKLMKPAELDTNKCLSCGESRNIGTRRYCSIECRKRLRYQLNLRSGLLKALNTRYATFYFTDEVLVMDVQPRDSDQFFSFIFPRTRGKKPVEDFSELCNILGNAWWKEMKRTNRKYLASRRVFRKADRRNNASTSVRPQETRIPTLKGRGKSLVYLKLHRSDLHSSELKQIIKSAFRRQAREYHPDMGGDDAAFRKIHEAYEDLVRWAEKPSFLTRSGFPDKWFYDGTKNRWVQPTPE